MEPLFEEKKGSEPSRKFELADSKVQVNAVGGKGWGSSAPLKRTRRGWVASRRSSSDTNKCRAAMSVDIMIVHLRTRWHSNEDAQGGRCKNLIDRLINPKKNNKVAPEGVKKGNYIDVEEFKREMKRCVPKLNM
ncbi:hypothetical protein TrLO_g1302 [Triparma laevis f. longispina]|uniref:Uncharacterized protein n=1 Tax=Triparma laevis f. longispina TaxID=1714387 RepID=A0A9W7KS08_9STRA|nr:hypothetical protein TrLO_g1302 [Triparma laevis f. longispina]